MRIEATQTKKMGRKLSVKGEKGLSYLELVLRALVLALGLITVIRLTTATQTVSFFGIKLEANFKSARSTIFLVVAYGIAVVYTFLQFLMLASSSAFGIPSLSNKIVAGAFFICDLGIAYVVLSAVAAELTTSLISENGIDEFGWLAVCKFVGDYCDESRLGVGASVVGALCLFSVSIISSFRCFRLCGSYATSLPSTSG